MLHTDPDGKIHTSPTPLPPLVVALDAVRWLMMHDVAASTLGGASIQNYGNEPYVMLSSVMPAKGRDRDTSGTSPEWLAADAALANWLLSLGGKVKATWYPRSCDNCEQRELRLVHNGIAMLFTQRRERGPDLTSHDLEIDDGNDTPYTDGPNSGM